MGSENNRGSANEHGGSLTLARALFALGGEETGRESGRWVFFGGAVRRKGQEEEEKAWSGTWAANLPDFEVQVWAGASEEAGSLQGGGGDGGQPSRWPWPGQGNRSTVFLCQQGTACTVRQLARWQEAIRQASSWVKLGATPANGLVRQRMPNPGGSSAIFILSPSLFLPQVLARPGPICVSLQ